MNLPGQGEEVRPRPPANAKSQKPLLSNDGVLFDNHKGRVADILQLTVNFSLRVDDRRCNIVHGSQRRLSNRARSKAYESCSRTRYE